MKFVKVELYNQTGKFQYINLDNVVTINKNFDERHNQDATYITFLDNDHYVTAMETPEEILGIDLKGKLDTLLE